MSEVGERKAVLQRILSELIDSRMTIGIRDEADDAESQPAPVIERHLARWEFTPEQEHVRLYFNPCQFVAVPIAAGELAVRMEAGQTLLLAQDRAGKLMYTIAFGRSIHAVST